ncbi:hypothetical protein V1478_005502 [Vespula squamosa]|uniref:Uncharacterized protein n=1 Tax=Vespula squamosa TaxID=30214 RepID=A0ABD2BED2_VESSQ
MFVRGGNRSGFADDLCVRSFSKRNWEKRSEALALTLALPLSLPLDRIYICAKYFPSRYPITQVDVSRAASRLILKYLGRSRNRSIVIRSSCHDINSLKETAELQKESGLPIGKEKKNHKRNFKKLRVVLNDNRSIKSSEKRCGYTLHHKATPVDVATEYNLSECKPAEPSKNFRRPETIEEVAKRNRNLEYKLVICSSNGRKFEDIHRSFRRTSIRREIEKGKVHFYELSRYRHLNPKKIPRERILSSICRKNVPQGRFAKIETDVTRTR